MLFVQLGPRLLCAKLSQKFERKQRSTKCSMSTEVETGLRDLESSHFDGFWTLLLSCHMSISPVQIARSKTFLMYMYRFNSFVLFRIAWPSEFIQQPWSGSHMQYQSIIKHKLKSHKQLIWIHLRYHLLNTLNSQQTTTISWMQFKFIDFPIFSCINICFFFFRLFNLHGRQVSAWSQLVFPPTWRCWFQQPSRKLRNTEANMAAATGHVTETWPWP